MIECCILRLRWNSLESKFNTVPKLWETNLMLLSPIERQCNFYFLDELRQIARTYLVKLWTRSFTVELNGIVLNSVFHLLIGIPLNNSKLYYHHYRTKWWPVFGTVHFEPDFRRIGLCFTSINPSKNCDRCSIYFLMLNCFQWCFISFT